MSDWSDYDHPKINVLRQYARNRSWGRIAEISGLSWEEARELGCFLRGWPLGKTLGSGIQRQPRKESPDPTNVIDSEQVMVESSDDERIVTTKSKTIRTLDELLTAAGVDRSKWRVEKWVANKWDGQERGGEPVELWQVKAWLERRPEWMLRPVQPVRHLKRCRSQSTYSRDAALIIPDSQNGYRWLGRHDMLEPLHDRQAWDLAVQMAQRLMPSTILLLGDMLDLAPWSTKYARGSNLSNTTQPALVELHWWLGQLRMASPGARIVYLEGNHEDRIAKALKQLLREADGVRPADDVDGPPAMGVSRLLALDSLDVEYVGPYDSEHWLWDSVRVHHGETVRRKGGATVSAVVQDATYCEVVGHVHRLELACRTVHGPDGVHVMWAMSPGTLARCDGVVPAATSRVDWQQGLGVVERDDEGRLFPQLLPIEAGRTIWCREVLEGRDRVEDLRAATGWPF